MKVKLLDWIVCPLCKSGLDLISYQEDNGEINKGILSCRCGRKYLIENYIPRFAECAPYLNSFSFEWKIHRKTQLDSATLNGVSDKAFQARIDFSLKDLKSKLVLDAGCGMGRYAEIAAQHQAEVIGFDLSQAVDIAFENIGFKDNVHLIQADIFNLPFRENIFDFIYSFGVLHHTPNCSKAFKQLPRLLKQDGKISIFVYSSYNKAIVYSSNFWRIFTTRLPKRLLYGLSFISVPLYFFYRIPLFGHIGKMFFVISMEHNWRWRILDTFDWYSPRYQSKHTHAEVFNWFQEEGLSNIKIFPGEITLLGKK